MIALNEASTGPFPDAVAVFFTPSISRDILASCFAKDPALTKRETNLIYSFGLSIWSPTRAIKSSSIDCNIHRNSNKKEGVVCYSFGAPSVNTFSYRPDYSSEEADTVEAQNLKGITWTGYPIKIEGMNYVIKRTDSHPSGKIGEIYDIESYYAAERDARNPPIQLGRTRINPAKPGHIQFLKVGDPDF